MRQADGGVRERVKSGGIRPARPLAPFFTYNLWKMSSAMSVAHRLAEIVSACALGLLAIWLGMLALGPEVYEAVRAFAYQDSVAPFALLFFFGGSVAVFFYLAATARYVLWEYGFFFELKALYITGYVAILGGALLTVAFWGFVEQDLLLKGVAW